MSDLTTTIGTYLASLTETDATRRAEMIARVWTADGRLTDPPLAAEGHAGISEAAAGLQAQYPGFRFRRVSGIDTHHDYLRFAWEFVSPDGAVALVGLDVGELAADGRLRRITGFFGELPQATAA